MKTRHKIILALSSVAMLLLSGCINLWQENIDIKTYMLETKREAPPLELPLASRLWISNVNVLPPYNVRSIILRKSEVEFSPSYYSEFLLSPSDNFRNCFYMWFADSSMFEEVSIGSRSGNFLNLLVSVREFYDDVPEKQAVLVLQVVLLSDKSENERVLMSQIYEERVDVPEEGVENLIGAYNQALTRILMKCEADVMDALQ